MSGEKKRDFECMNLRMVFMSEPMASEDFIVWSGICRTDASSCSFSRRPSVVVMTSGYSDALIFRSGIGSSISLMGRVGGR